MSSISQNARVVKLGDVCHILDSRRRPVTAKDRIAGPYPYYGANGVQDYVNDYIFDDDLVLLAEDGGHFGSKTKPIAYRVSGKCWVNNHAHVLKPKQGLNIDYLCYSIMYYDVSKLVNGATRQKLTQADMRKMKIPLRDESEQLKVVSILDSVFDQINLYQKWIDMLDDLVKSRFVEMFGDPALNPNGYPKTSLSQIASYYGGLTYRPSDVVEEGGTIVLRSANIQDGSLVFEDVVRVSCKIRDRFFVRQNDILMCSRNGSARLVGKAALIKNLAEPMSFGAFMMIIRSEYYQYLLSYLHTHAFRSQVQTGTATINQITGRMLDSVVLPVPPIQLVREFETFVQQVDKSRFAVQRAIEQLETLKTSLMQEYFG